MDMTKLITMGRMEKTLDVGGVSVKLATPIYTKMPDQGTPDPIEVLSRHVTQIDEEQFTTPESKNRLKTLLSQMQSVVVGKLLEEVNTLVNEQILAVNGIVTKKD